MLQINLYIEYIWSKYIRYMICRELCCNNKHIITKKSEVQTLDGGRGWRIYTLQNTEHFKTL